MEFKIEARSRIITEYFVEIDGVSFDVEDVVETLSWIEAGDNIYINHYKLTEVLVGIEVLESGGSIHYPATAGPKFNEFYESLKKECEKMRAIGFDISC